MSVEKNAYHYKRLKVWQKAMELVVHVYKATKNFPRDEQYGLTSQMRRSAVSIPSNIAEGHGRNSEKELLRFLDIAKGSIYELDTQIEISRQLNYMNTQAFNYIDKLLDEISRMLSGLGKSKTPNAKPKTQPSSLNTHNSQLKTRFAFSTNAFRNSSFHEAAKAISKAGYTGIEIMCDTPHAWPFDLSDGEIDKIRDTLERHHLEISNLNAFMMCAVKDFHHPSWIEPDPDFRQIRIDYTRACIELAHKLGARTLSTEPGGPLDGMSEGEALEIFAKGLETVLPVARDKGITLLIEPEPDLLIETSDQYLSFIEAFNHPNLGLNFDVGHFYCVGEDPVLTVEKLKDHARHYHLEDIPKTRAHKHIIPGQGGIDIPGVLKAIQKTGYKGYITVELYPYLDNPQSAAGEAKAYIDKVIG